MQCLIRVINTQSIQYMSFVYITVPKSAAFFGMYLNDMLYKNTYEPELFLR